MFEKNTNTTDKYKLNNKTSLTVKNTRIEGERGETYYRSEITLKHKASQDKPVMFNNSDEVSDFISNIDFDDNHSWFDHFLEQKMNYTPHFGAKSVKK